MSGGKHEALQPGDYVGRDMSPRAKDEGGDGDGRPACLEKKVPQLFVLLAFLSKLF